jgi:hypothetical protein
MRMGASPAGLLGSIRSPMPTPLAARSESVLPASHRTASRVMNFLHPLNVHGAYFAGGLWIIVDKRLL